MALNVMGCSSSYETQVVFVPDMKQNDIESCAIELARGGSPAELFRMAIEDIRMGVPKGKGRVDIIDKNFEANKEKIVKQAQLFTYNLNKLSNDGWEIKTSRRVWIDLNENGSPNECEWGTEYTLQKKKGLW
jgi:hypothetical protein